MNPFLIWHFVQFAFYIFFIILYLVIFKCLGSKPIYFSLLQWMFSIDHVSNENSQIILNFYGKQMNFSDNKRFRVLLKILVILCFYVVTIIFFDGCILSTIFMDPDAECPEISDSNCFSFGSSSGLNPDVFDCPRNVLISSTNATSRIIVCYSWMIKSQSVFGVINQLGICTSILSLLGFTFHCIYRLASWKRWGTCLIILLGLFMLALLLVCLIVLRVRIAYLDLVLLIAGLLLLINALLLVGLVRKLDRRAKSNCIEPIESPVVETTWTNRKNHFFLLSSRFVIKDLRFFLLLRFSSWTIWRNTRLSFKKKHERSFVLFFLSIIHITDNSTNVDRKPFHFDLNNNISIRLIEKDSSKITKDQWNRK